MTIDADKIEGRQVVISLGLLWRFFAGIVGVIIIVGGWIWNDVTGDIGEVNMAVGKEGKARADWVKDEFKPHINKFDEHVTAFGDLKVDVGVVVDRTNSMADRTNSIGTNNIEAIMPSD